MNIAVLGDLHGNYNALVKVLADIENCHADHLIVLGDIVFFGEEPQKCFDVLRKLNPLVWIRGNTDDWFNEMNEDYVPTNDIEERVFNEFKHINPLINRETGIYLSMLKEKDRVTLSGRKILCVHGSDRHINEPVGYMTPVEDLRALCSRLDTDIMLCAHTHLPFSASLNGKIIINVGSVGKPADEPRPCWCLLKIEDGVFSYEFRRLSL